MSVPDKDLVMKTSSSSSLQTVPSSGSMTVPSSLSLAAIVSSVASETDFEHKFNDLIQAGDNDGAKLLLEKATKNTIAQEGPLPTESKSTIAFAFDIDGVFIRSTNRLENGPETIRMLQELRIPFVFLTNGGTKTEEAHAAKLSSILGVDIEGKNFIQSHTPWLELVPKFKDRYILAVGGDGNDCREVAHAYGFEKVITPADIMVAYPNVYPFSDITRYHSLARPLPDHSDENPLQIAAILVWSSPRDWGLDTQVIIDLVLSENGHLGTRAPTHGPFLPENGLELHFSNADYTYASDYHLPRFAQGAFASALHGIISHQHGAQLVSTTIGKPTETTYLYAEKILHEYHHQIHAESGSQEPLPGIKTVYMVGDNPLSDIAGANMYQSRYGSQWKSILVETGVHVPGTTPAVCPTKVVKGVREAVEWALAEDKREKEGTTMERDDYFSS